MPVPCRPPWVVTSNPLGVGRLAGRHPAGVDRQHQHLIAEPLGDLGDQLRPGDRRGVDPDLVGAGAQQRVDIGDRPHAPADGQRDEHLLGRAPHDVIGRLAITRRRGDVEEGQLVGALGVVAAGQFDRITGIAQPDEVDALDDPPGVDVETRDHPHGDAHVDRSCRDQFDLDQHPLVDEAGHHDHRRGRADRVEQLAVRPSDRVGIGAVA